MENTAALVKKFESEFRPFNARLVAVSKTRKPQEILLAYEAGQRLFGENYVQELLDKKNSLPEDIQWHFIGHLQTNKVKSLAPFIACIQSVDSVRLLHEIDKQAARNDRKIDCLLQIHIANESSKFGFTPDEALTLMNDPQVTGLKNIRIIGLMGMATNTDDLTAVRSEFRSLKKLFDKLKVAHTDFHEISMGMSGDYKIALEEGASLIRIGSSIFGERVQTVK
ncbi:MAG: YggS family pyridoxal phosphate-dependent enzyme [Bacteroidota bacterium]